MLGECFGEDYVGRLGDACSIHARPLWGSLGGLGQLGAACGMLGNASGRLGECLGMLREVRGGLGKAWGMLCECFGEECLGMLQVGLGLSGPQPASRKDVFGTRFCTFIVQLHSQPAKRMTGLFYPGWAFGGSQALG